jgi:DNA-binding MurR/RpiR family transcriptional regulator
VVSLCKKLNLTLKLNVGHNDQRTICLYLSRKGFSAHAIHEKLVQLLGPDAIAYSIVTYHLRASRWTAQTEERHSDPPPEVVDKAILEALDQTPLASVRELAKTTCIPRTTVWSRLTESLGFFVKHLRWVPHNLTDAQR